MSNKTYASSVFVNCPFDDSFISIFEAIIFAIIDCGFIPRCALENGDSDQVRLTKIEKIISECKYGIHDISMAELDKNTQLPRFNMPFELGIFLGAKRFGEDDQKNKSCIILDREPYRYQKFISDIAGQDIRYHNSSPEKAIKTVRAFLSDKTKRKTIPSSTIIWEHFTKFNSELPEMAKALDWDYKEITFVERCTLIKEWLELEWA